MFVNSAYRLFHYLILFEILLYFLIQFPNLKSLRIISVSSMKNNSFRTLSLPFLIILNPFLQVMVIPSLNKMPNKFLFFTKLVWNFLLRFLQFNQWINSFSKDFNAKSEIKIINIFSTYRKLFQTATTSLFYHILTV